MKKADVHLKQVGSIKYYKIFNDWIKCWSYEIFPCYNIIWIELDISTIIKSGFIFFLSPSFTFRLIHIRVMVLMESWTMILYVKYLL